MRSLENLIMRL